MPFSEMTATSEVPPPMSSTIEPRASSTGRPAPIAADIGSSIRYTSRAPAPAADSWIARRSTWVEPQGTQTSTRGLGRMILRLVHLVDEVLQHLLGDREVGDDAFLQRADGGDVVRRAAEHLLGFFADRGHRFCAAGTAVLANGDHGWFVQHDALAAGIDQGVGGAQVDGQVVREHTANASKEHE